MYACAHLSANAYMCVSVLLKAKELSSPVVGVTGSGVTHCE